MKTRKQILRQIKQYGQGQFVIFTYAGSRSRLWGWGTISSPIGRYVLIGEIDPDYGTTIAYPQVADVETVEV